MTTFGLAGNSWEKLKVLLTILTNNQTLRLRDYRSGSAADTQAVTDNVKHYINAHRLLINHIHTYTYVDAITCFSNLNSFPAPSWVACRESRPAQIWWDWFVTTTKIGLIPSHIHTYLHIHISHYFTRLFHSMQAGMICGGWDPYEGK